MNWKDWMPLYREIERDFGFPREREVESRSLLSKILGSRVTSIEEIGKIIEEEVYVAGYGPNLEREISKIPEGACIVAADDAAPILAEVGMEPRIVLTDLDGDITSLLELKNSVIGIHAHGDNMELLEYASLFRRRFGTTQIEPVENVYNFGGFTDGDRGVFLATHFGARVYLVGFDFKNPRVKEWKDPERKRRKLAWAERLIDELRKMGAVIEKV